MTALETPLLVFARSAGFTFRAPGFSHPSVPAPVRAGLALCFALAIAPGVRPAVPLDGVAFVIALAGEFLLGSAIGFGASLIYDAAYAGGRIVDDYVGVKAIAPSVQLVAPSGFGRVWSLAFTGGFFLLGAYRSTILAFAQSFARLPPAAAFDAHARAPFAGAYASTFAIAALGVAAPAIASAFVAQIALGALTRVVPRLGSLALTFPLAFAAALIATALAVRVAAR